MCNLRLPLKGAATRTNAYVVLRPQRAVRLPVVIFDKAGIGSTDQAALLGVSPTTLRRYRRGVTTPHRRNILAQIEDLLRIHNALRAMFPNNHDLVRQWFTSSNRGFAPNPVYETPWYGEGAPINRGRTPAMTPFAYTMARRSLIQPMLSRGISDLESVRNIEFEKPK